MATSGTLGTMVIDTAILLEHAFRRAGLSVSKQTPETVDAARESLYLLLLNLSNSGLNLWCLETVYVGLTPQQAKYQLPVGTLDATNVIFSQPTIAATSTAAASPVTLNVGAAQLVTRVGVAISNFTSSDTITLSYSTDNVAWTVAAAQTGNLMATMWFNIDPTVSAQYWKVATTSSSTITIALASAIYDLPVTPWSRDTYQAINNKDTAGRPSTSYLLERKLDVSITLWPVPTALWDHLTVVRHRQVQDIGSLSQQIEVPQRWLEGIAWETAFRIAVEVPGVDPSRIDLCGKMAEKYVFDASDDESDGMPLRIAPSISGYTS